MSVEVKYDTKKLVANSVKKEAFAQRDENLEQIAWRIVHHPKLRAAYFADPDVSFKDARAGKDKHKLALLIELLINEDQRLISAKETFYERESFLRGGVQDPQETFGAVAWMSKVTFGLGVALVAVGVVLAFLTVRMDESTTEQITVGALGAFFGGSGIVTTLLAVFRATTKELRSITSDMAKIHMILTGYGAQTTGLRASKKLQGPVERNEEYRAITKHAVELLPSDRPPSAGDEETNEPPEQNVAPSG